MAGIDINMGCPKPFSINVSLLDQWTCQSCFAELDNIRYIESRRREWQYLCVDQDS